MSPLLLVRGVLLRALLLTVVIAIYGVALNNSESTDALGAGLLAFLILTAISFVWALVDGVRSGFKSAVLIWSGTAVTAGIAVPLALSLTGASGESVATSVRESAIFFILLLFVPSVLGLGIGALVRQMRGGRTDSTVGAHAA